MIQVIAESLAHLYTEISLGACGRSSDFLACNLLTRSTANIISHTITLQIPNILSENTELERNFT
ncbi:hypothetical protein [Nostoc sp. C052]|uniref:hypothetical protein n=1 Tax=Nostoc sp. C052 TaxID=2576902 RepID=UPI001C4D64C8|nr:hypothetical protein [Nostoc sp. C052]